jgi:hypothetical protein
VKNNEPAAQDDLFAAADEMPEDPPVRSAAESPIDETGASLGHGLRPAEPRGEVPDEGAVRPGAIADRWNIRKLICFSHDARRRDVDLDLGAVNIITGNSHTGKSSLAELIDYVMGAQDCYLPGRVFDASAWVGILWGKSGTQCLICRRVPEQRPRGTDDFVYQVGADLAIPQDAGELKATLGRDEMLKRFESLLGIGDAKTEVFGSATNTPVRVSFRNAMPYLLQDAQHIINKGHLLRGLDTQQRQHLLDTLPYYLGVVDERTVAREAELRQLRLAILAEERRQAERNAIVGPGNDMAQTLLREAADAGLLAEEVPADAPLDDVHAALRRALDRSPEAPEVFGSDEALGQLYEREQVLGTEGTRLRARIEATRRALDAAGGFSTTGEVQHQRLEVVDLLPGADGGTCPLCVQPLHAVVEAPVTVRRAADRIREELAEVARERPKLDGTLAALEEERARVAREVAEVRAQITRMIQASDERQRFTSLDRQRVHAAGRISLYLQTAAPPAPAERTSLTNLDELRERERALADDLDVDAKLEALAVARTRLGVLATEVARLLPLEEAYVGQSIDVNLRNLTVSVVTARQREEMRSIGSDENCLSLHVAVLVALHRMFGERRRPVPGFLLFDQLSRPYYPPDPLGAGPEEEVASTQPEVASLKQYFDALFLEAARGEGFQVLVLEHAYFSDDDHFKAATRERWIGGKALIPADWPNRV